MAAALTDHGAMEDGEVFVDGGRSNGPSAAKIAKHPSTAADAEPTTRAGPSMAADTPRTVKNKAEIIAC